MPAIVNRAVEEQEPGGPEMCECPDCDYEVEKKRGVPCRSMECPDCGAALVAKVVEEANDMPIVDVGQIAKSAIETALAVVKGGKEITAERAEKLLYKLEADLGEIWQPGDTLDAWQPRKGMPVAEIAEFDVDGRRVSLSELIDTYREAVWTTAFVNDLPDSSFALIMPGGEKDAEGKTTPRSLRKLPYKDADGKVDLAHLRNALARVSQVEGASEAQIAGARRKLEAAAKQNLKTYQEEADVPGLRELLEQALALLPSDTAESFTESASEAANVEDFIGDLSELGIDAVAETGRRAPVLVDFQILQPGPGNKKDNHYYPREMVERDAHVFNGVDVFATDHREKERSERTKVARVKECPTRFTESGAPVAQVVIYDPDQAEKTRNRADAGELGTLECSIYARGVSKPGTIDGKEYKVVEAITEGKYLELVSSAGAGGRALNLSESDAGGNEMGNTEGVTEVVQEEDIQENEPAPVEEPTGEPVGESAPEPESLAEAEVEAALAETNLPGVFKTALSKGEYANADVLKAAIADAIAEVKALTGSGQPFGQGVTQPIEELSGDKKELRDIMSFNETMREVGCAPVPIPAHLQYLVEGGN